MPPSTGSTRLKPIRCTRIFFETSVPLLPHLTHERIRALLLAVLLTANVFPAHLLASARLLAPGMACARHGLGCSCLRACLRGDEGKHEHAEEAKTPKPSCHGESAASADGSSGTAPYNTLPSQEHEKPECRMQSSPYSGPEAVISRLGADNYISTALAVGPQNSVLSEAVCYPPTSRPLDLSASPPTPPPEA